MHTGMDQQQEAEPLFPVRIYIKIKITYLASFHESASAIVVGTKEIYCQNTLHVTLNNIRSPDSSRRCISWMIKEMINDQPVILEYIGDELELLSEKVSCSICEQAEAISVGSNNSGFMQHGIKLFDEETVDENEIPLVVNELSLNADSASILEICSVKPETISENNSEICSICLYDYSEGEVVCQLPCSHLFHCTCIIKWHARSSSCPLCRCTI